MKGDNYTGLEIGMHVESPIVKFTIGLQLVDMIIWVKQSCSNIQFMCDVRHGDPVHL
jgi:hypothetical protein